MAKFMTMPLNARRWVRRGSDFESEWPSERQFLEKQRREVWSWPDAFCPRPQCGVARELGLAERLRVELKETARESRKCVHNLRQ